MPTDNKRLRCKNADCKRLFTRPQGTNRLYCFECRPERTVVNFPPNPAESAENDENQGPTLVDYTKKALEDAGVLESWQGASAMELAKLIVAGKHGASGAAGTIKALREAMAVAMADSGEDADVIDMIFAEGSA